MRQCTMTSNDAEVTVSVLTEVQGLSTVDRLVLIQAFMT